ncbi:MAG: hypothetical protein A2046_02275 [Bacteroidetes bacterium GWA2_30_7]|nr:MAG: hypothetical protein A2046_02275 [Bacteroidetes bacterium GWA2_30_7]
MENINDTSGESALNNCNKVAIPSSTGVLVMGIISISTCFCYGIPGLVLGIISLSLAGKGKRLYKANPQLYTDSSYKNLKAGLICAIIGTSLSGLFLLIMLIYIFVVGLAITSLLDPGIWL